MKIENLIHTFDKFCQAQPQLNSTQLKLRLSVSLISTLIQPPTHPEQKITHDFFKIIQDFFKDASRLIQDYFKTTLIFTKFLQISNHTNQQVIYSNIAPSSVFRGGIFISILYGL